MKEHTMYGLMITFTAAAPLDDLEAPFTDYAHALTGIQGLISKAWLHDGTTVGGFHVFVDQAAAEGYLASDLAMGLRATDGFDDFEVRGFDILDGLSAITGVAPTTALAE